MHSVDATFPRDVGCFSSEAATRRHNPNNTSELYNISHTQRSRNINDVYVQGVS